MSESSINTQYPGSLLNVDHHFFTVFERYLLKTKQKKNNKKKPINKTHVCQMLLEMRLMVLDSLQCLECANN